MAEDEGIFNLTWRKIMEVVPSRLKGLFKNPIKWVNKRIVQFILGAVGAFVFEIAKYIELTWTIIRDAFVSAGEPIATTIDDPETEADIVGYVGELTREFNDVVFEVAGIAGPLSPALVIFIYAATFTILFIILRAAAPAVTDLLGSIPVVGSILDAILTFAIQAGDRFEDWWRGSS